MGSKTTTATWNSAWLTAADLNREFTLLQREFPLTDKPLYAGVAARIKAAVPQPAILPATKLRKPSRCKAFLCKLWNGEV